MLSTVISAFLEHVMPIIIVWGVLFVVKSFNALISKIEEKSPISLTIASTFASMAVEAAEQIFPESKNGKEKFDYAMGLIDKYLSEKNISMDFDEISALIESSVHRMNKEKK